MTFGVAPGAASGQPSEGHQGRPGHPLLLQTTALRKQTTKMGRLCTSVHRNWPPQKQEIENLRFIHFGEVVNTIFVKDRQKRLHFCRCIVAGSGASMKRILDQKRSGNEVYFTNSSILLVKNMLCSNLHCRKGFDLIILSNRSRVEAASRSA